MAYDGWLQFAGVEMVNLARTAALCETMGIDAMWTEYSAVEWITNALAGTGYESVANAPWYDAGYPASSEFAGIVPLSIAGLDDSTRESTTIEYITDGGSSGKPRNKTKVIVANVAIMASTDRGADYGKRWLDRVLAGSSTNVMFCSGDDLRYFRYAQGAGVDAPDQLHRRDVTVTRGTSVTRKRTGDCSVVWMATFTWTANDPFEYTDEMAQFAGLGGALVGPAVASSGSVALTETECPVFDYTPLYDPLYPALVAGPDIPDFYPEGWALLPGVTIQREWVRLDPVEPSALDLVPVLTLSTDVAARYVRVCVWPGDAPFDSLCDPLWTAIVSYLPPSLSFVIDGEQQASYVWDGISPRVRRTDSLVFTTNGRPMKWSAFNDPAGLLVTLDVISGGSGDYDGDGTVEAALSLVSKSN
jgi:hypothetical protein